VYELFLSAFCIAVPYIDAGTSLPVRIGSKVIMTRTMQALVLSRASIHVVKSPLGYLLHREFMRWHPNELNRWFRPKAVKLLAKLRG
jgi:hypothetical protein